MPGKYIGIKSHPAVDGVLTEIDSIKTKKFKELPKQVSKKGSAFWMSGNEKTLLIRTRQGGVNHLKIGVRYNTDYFDHCLLYIGEAIGRMEQLEADKKIADSKQVINQEYEITLLDDDAVNAFFGHYTKQFIQKEPPVKIFEIDDYVKWGTPLREGKIIAFTGTHNDALIKSSNGGYTQVRPKRLEHAEKPIKVGDYVKSNGGAKFEGTVIELYTSYAGNHMANIDLHNKHYERCLASNLEHATKPDDDCIAVGDCVKILCNPWGAKQHNKYGKVIGIEWSTICNKTLYNMDVNGYTGYNLSIEKIRKVKKVPAKKDGCKIGVGDMVHTTVEYTQEFFEHVTGRVTKVDTCGGCVCYAVYNSDTDKLRFIAPKHLRKCPDKPKRAICVGDTVRTTEGFAIKYDRKYHSPIKGLVTSIDRMLPGEIDFDIHITTCCGEKKAYCSKWLELIEPRGK